MGIRRNIKFLNATDKENFVKACVLMKAHIVNPGALPANQYSKWDEYVAIHLMIQNAFAPGFPGVNFGHGSNGSYSFLSWHRYFLYQFELQLQTYVPGIMLPYWDWSDPVDIAVDNFLGPTGTAAAGYAVQTGYFAFDKPGVGANTTPLPVWWPATLNGWRLPAMFPATAAGALRRKFRSVAALPTLVDIKTTMTRTDYPTFQDTMQTGVGLASGNIMHGAMHGFIGDTVGHMSTAAVSAFDPYFYVMHCNIDRLWAMWQMDGHQNEYPNTGPKPPHYRDAIMYPWTGGAAGYGTNVPIAGLPMPDFSALGAKRNVDTLDFRNALGYSYDTIPIIGIGLDRTGSMSGVVPDPMMTGLPDITKWIAAKRAVSAFLHDCETVQESSAVYVMAGIQTFRTLGANQFDNVFGAPGFGLIKAGTSFSQTAFDSAIVSMNPGGGTPLADALNNVQNTLVQPPFGGVPATEQRYMAFLTDGLLTTGAPLSSIPNGSFNRTAVFAMGFGTGADVDYPTLNSLVAKGKAIPVTQVFHGESAGAVDKFYSHVLASAIGFTGLIDPVIELFAGEHTHVNFTATSAEDAFFITAQGMDFQDKNWSFVLHAPNGQVLYGTEDHQHSEGHCNHCCTLPDITSKRSNGRVTLVIQRGNTEKECWVGTWELMIYYKTKQTDAMMMMELGELLFPVAAGPVRGAKYSRLLTEVKNRIATRNVVKASRHGLDNIAASTNSNSNEACTMVVNIYGRTNLKMNLHTGSVVVKKGEEFKISVDMDINTGSVKNGRGFARFISPAFDMEDILPRETVIKIIRQLESARRPGKKFDIALLLAHFEKERKNAVFTKDNQGKLVSHDGGPFHLHMQETGIPGLYHFGVYLEGLYFPKTAAIVNDHHDHQVMHSSMDMNNPGDEEGELFTRILNITVAVTK